MAIYLIDSAGALVGPIELPVTPGMGVQLPGNGIELAEALGDPLEGCAWTLVDDVPQQVADWRGTLYRTDTGEPVQHDALGGVPAGLTPDQRPSAAHAWSGEQWVLDATLAAELLADEQSRVWERIKAERARRTTGGGIQVGAHWFHSDTISRNQHLGLKDQARDRLAAGGAQGDILQADGADVQWKTMGGTFVPITVQLAFDIVQAATDSDARIFKAAEVHREQMLASAEPAAYDYSAGWPAVFGE